MRGVPVGYFEEEKKQSQFWGWFARIFDGWEEY